MNEPYGLSKSQYRKLIESPVVSARMLSEKIVKPDCVYRYRRLGHMNNGSWKENCFWEDDIDGICMFSVPDSFNKNDSDDCKVRFDNDTVLGYMSLGDRRLADKKTNAKIDSILNDYKASLQKRMRVGCFTSVEPSSLDMWNDPNFGDDGRGVCFKYVVDEDNFYPDKLSFLPVLYDDSPYDSTKVMKFVVDYAKDNNNQQAANGMVCLGYGHTLIKPTKYENEHEWRLVVPIRDNKAHLAYFDNDHEKKRDMSSAISAVYLGPRFDELIDFEKYKCAIINRWRSKDVPIYQMVVEDGEHIKPVEIISE